jgi:hypothetical protein
MQPTAAGDEPMLDEHGLALHRSRYARFGFTGIFFE